MLQKIYFVVLSAVCLNVNALSIWEIPALTLARNSSTVEEAAWEGNFDLAGGLKVSHTPEKVSLLKAEDSTVLRESTDGFMIRIPELPIMSAFLRLMTRDSFERVVNTYNSLNSKSK
jgi:hypothetical protein